MSEKWIHSVRINRPGKKVIYNQWSYMALHSILFFLHDGGFGHAGFGFILDKIILIK
jgi:hypothetical protein